MKKIIVGLAALTSISAFAGELNCSAKFKAIGSTQKEQKKVVALTAESDYKTATIEKAAIPSSDQTYSATMTVGLNGNPNAQYYITLYQISGQKVSTWGYQGAGLESEDQNGDKTTVHCFYKK